jgi:hypothetical protein
MPKIAKRLLMIVTAVVLIGGVALWAVVRYGRDVLWPSGMLPGDIVAENSAIVCFSHAVPGSGKDIIVQVNAMECRSSTCTDRFVEQAHVEVDEQAHTIDVTTLFIYRDATVEGFQCTTDCAGGGMVIVNIGSVSPGVYAVGIGEEQVGEIEIAEKPGGLVSGLCLSSGLPDESPGRATARPASSPPPYPGLFTPDIGKYP